MNKLCMYADALRLSFPSSSPEDGVKRSKNRKISKIAFKKQKNNRKVVLQRKAAKKRRRRKN